MNAGSAIGHNGAKWIWCGDTADYEHCWAWARKTFDWDGRSPATLGISADLRYLAWLNGKRLGFGPPKFHQDTPTADIYDLTKNLRPGPNLLAVQVYSLGPAPISSCMPRRGALWVELQLGSDHILSDATWKMRSDPGYMRDTARRGEMQPPSEHYDARFSLGSPEREDFADSEWPFARELSDPLPTFLEKRDIPFMTVHPHEPDRMIECGVAEFPKAYASITPAERAGFLAHATTLPDRGDKIRIRQESSVEMDARDLGMNQSLYALFDLGRIWTGYPLIHLEGCPGTIVDLSYSEDLMNHRICPDKSLPYHDRIVLGGTKLEHRITWPKCARYLQINVHGGRTSLSHLAWERSTYPVQRQGFFSCDDPVLNQAVEISLHTVQLCMEDSYMDTPWRERGSWLGDDLLKARIASTFFEDHALAKRFLLHHARGQRETGMFQGKYPGNVTSDVSTWSLRFAPSLLEYCAESGDWKFGEELWPALERLWQWLESLQTPAGLFQAPSVHVDAHTNRYNFIDWAPIEMRGANAAWNAFAHACLRAIGDIARQIGRKSEVEKMTAFATAHRRSFQRNFWDDRRGVFVNGLVEGALTERWGCHENYLAILYGLSDDRQTARILERLRREDFLAIFSAQEADYDEEPPNVGKIPTVSLALSKYRWPDSRMVPIGTPYFAGFMLDALCDLGLVREALDFIEQHWGKFSRQGATTVWETWNSEQSLSHGWSAAPALLAARVLLGVQRAGVSGNTCHILPHVEDHQTLRGRVATRAGIVQVDWKDRVLTVDIPPGLKFFAGLPLPDKTTLWLDGSPAEKTLLLRRNGRTYTAVPVTPGRHQLTGLDPATSVT